MDTPNGQLTVQWHIDDVRASCKDKFEVTKLFAYLNNIYGKKVVAHRGKKTEYLGMSFDYLPDGEVLVDMIQYIGKIFEEFPEAIMKTSPTPAADHLFSTRDEEDARYLPEEQAQEFHRSVAQLLFLSTRARPDIATAVSFLTSRVKRPDEDDWGKLRRVLQYLKGTRKLKMCLKVNSLEEAHWFVDVSHAVHWNCKGQRADRSLDDTGQRGHHQHILAPEDQHQELVRDRAGGGRRRHINGVVVALLH